MGRMWLSLLCLAVLQAGTNERLEAPLRLVETDRLSGESIRALSRALQPGDGPWLMARSATLTPSAELGLVQALGAEERHLGLCAELAALPRGRAQALGESALASQIAEFVPSTVERSDEPEEWVAELAEQGRWAWLEAPADLWEGLRELLPLAVDPELECGALPGRAEWAGELGDLLLEASSRSESLVVGTGHAWGASHARWLALLPRAAAGRVKPQDLLRRWLQEARSDDARLRERALRALSATRWPAALLLVEQRAMGGDRAAREVALELAARGAVLRLCFAPAFLGEVWQELCSTPDAARAELLARALSGIGPLDAEGAPSLGFVFDAPISASARTQALTLMILSEWDSTSPKALEWVNRLAAEARDPGLRLLAWRVGVGAGAAPPSADALEPVFAWADHRDHRERRERVEAVLASLPPRWSRNADCLHFPKTALRAGERSALARAVLTRLPELPEKLRLLNALERADRDALIDALLLDSSLPEAQREPLRALLEDREAPANAWPSPTIRLDSAWR